MVQLDVGDLVVYGNHGIGRVVARRSAAVGGVETETVVVELSDGMTITLALDQARTRLRSPLGPADIPRVRETLQTESAASSEPWLKRRRLIQARLSEGDPLAIAEIVREGADRQRAKAARSTTLSAGEKALYSRARQLLAGELGVALDLDEAGANAWIDEHALPAELRSGAGAD